MGEKEIAKLIPNSFNEVGVDPGEDQVSFRRYISQE